MTDKQPAPGGRLAIPAALVLALLSTPAIAAPPEPPYGNWLTQDHNAVIAIAPCGNAVCGSIAGVPLAIPSEPVPTDNHGRSQCHLTILWDAKPAGAEYKGRILDPRNGKVYSILLSLNAQRSLRVRGYLGIPLLGSTQTWTPFTAPVPPDCRLPPRDSVPAQAPPARAAAPPA